MTNALFAAFAVQDETRRARGPHLSRAACRVGRPGSAGAYGSATATLPLEGPAPEVLSDIFLAASGKLVPNAVVQLWKPVMGTAQDYANYSYTNANVQSVSISGATATIAFTSQSESFTLANPQGP